MPWKNRQRRIDKPSRKAELILMPFNAFRQCEHALPTMKACCAAHPLRKASWGKGSSGQLYIPQTALAGAIIDLLLEPAPLRYISMKIIKNTITKVLTNTAHINEI